MFSWICYLWRAQYPQHGVDRSGTASARQRTTYQCLLTLASRKKTSDGKWYMHTNDSNSMHWICCWPDRLTRRLRRWPLLSSSLVRAITRAWHSGTRRRLATTLYKLLLEGKATQQYHHLHSLTCITQKFILVVQSDTTRPLSNVFNW